PFVDGTFEYHDRRLAAEFRLWRARQQILNVQARLPLDLSLTAVERRQLPGGLSVRATAGSVGLSVVEAITPPLQHVVGAFSGDTITFQRLSARSDKGSADVAGIVRLERLTHPVLALKITADQFKALDLKNNVTITASGQLALRGPVLGATVTGRAKVTSGVLYFADLVQKRLVNLDELADTSLASP